MQYSKSLGLISIALLLMMLTGCGSPSKLTNPANLSSESNLNTEQTISIDPEIIAMIPENLQNDSLDRESHVQKPAFASCNALASESVCIDYVGAFRTPENMLLICEYDDATILDEPCPPSDIGGCRVSIDQETENVLRYYETGGHPYDLETAQYSKAYCNTFEEASRVVPPTLQ